MPSGPSRPLRLAEERHLYRTVGRRGEVASEVGRRIERLTSPHDGVENDVTYWDATRSVFRTLRTP